MSNPRLSLLQKTGYASGNLGKSVVWSTLEYFFLFFLTELWGVTPAVAGLVILGAFIWDAISDPLLGFIADRSASPMGKYGPFLVFGAPLCAASFSLIFVHPGLGPAGMAWYALATGIAFRTCYTICDVPHNALMARISENSRDASLLSGLRFFFSSLGALAVSISAASLFASGDAVAQMSQFRIFALVAGVIYVLAMWTAWWSTRDLDRQFPNASREFSFLQSVRGIRQNGQLRLLLAIAFCQVVSIPVFTKSLAYYAKYELGTEAWISAALTVMTLTQALSMAGWTCLGRRWQKRSALMLAYSGIIAAALAFAVTSRHGAGMLPAMALAGVAVGGINMLLWALLPDAINHGEHQTGIRVEALSTSLFLFVLKSGIGLGSLLLGSLLAWSGLEPGQVPDQSFNLRLIFMMTCIPAIGALLCMILLSRWRLVHDDIEDHARRQAA
ncbi:MFS transporter [Hyphomonas sp.]|uniref:MFS transporter n=1 Tax=Hyphomonas sp. TaxID=87 RepID=UPI0030F52C5A